MLSTHPKTSHPLLPPSHRAFQPVLRKVAEMSSQPREAAAWCRDYAEDLCGPHLRAMMDAAEISAFDQTEFLYWLHARANELEASCGGRG